MGDSEPMRFDLTEEQAKHLASLLILPSV